MIAGPTDILNNGIESNPTNRADFDALSNSVVVSVVAVAVAEKVSFDPGGNLALSKV